MTTVLTLKNGMIRFQLSQLMWTVVTICMVVFQCKFFAGNTLNGLFWFFFPMATVVMNDISAYFCGITMGRKFIQMEFISLSPNKTWEGFIGAAVLTTAFGFLFPVFLSQYTWFTCPVHDLYIWEAPPPLSCDINEVFLPREYSLPEVIVDVLAVLPSALVTLIPGLSGANITLLPIQLHGVAYGLFASFIAPFGGFLASGIKRAYKRKDFDSIFPGHGGLMDRMDCILVMIFFTSFHFRTFIEKKAPSVGQVISLLQLLSVEQRQAVAATLQEMLTNGQ
jgi:phosphatidate cytidylyltransferase